MNRISGKELKRREENARDRLQKATWVLQVVASICPYGFAIKQALRVTSI